jgi:hypothetical protein|tara:strand:- start:529 stop:756 length:228 start_codon:yes stop_codon:yes gene_type:complete
MDEIDKHNVNDIIEINQIKKLLKTSQQKEVFTWLCDIVSKSLNGKTTTNPVELTFEETSEDEDDLDLSDHSSDED